MKVSVVIKTSRSCWSQSAAAIWCLAILLGLSLAPQVAVAQFRGANAAADEEEEEEDPLANLTGLLDPSLAKPLMTSAEEKEFRARKEPNYMRKALKTLSPNRTIEDQIREGVKFRVERLTMPENWPNIANRTKDLVNDLDVFADDAPRAREIAARAAVEELEKLLFSDQPKFVKINAAWLLGRLNIQSIDRRNKTPAVPYAPAAEPMVKVLNDSQQPIDVKVAAVRGVQRIMEDGDPSRQIRDKISEALFNEIKRIEDYTPGEGRDWYQWRLVDALGAVEFPRTMTQQTYVVDVLWDTMHDEQLPWHIRTRAARSLGQLRLDASFNIPLLVHEIVLLAGRMTAAYNQNPNLSFWKTAFSDLYFAFRAQTSRQQERGWGLLQNPPPTARGVIEGGYQQVLPLVNSVLKHEKPTRVPNALLGNAATWMKSNTPTDKKIHQQADPLVEKKPAPNPANPAGQGTQLSQPRAGALSGNSPRANLATPAASALEPARRE